MNIYVLESNQGCFHFKKDPSQTMYVVEMYDFLVKEEIHGHKSLHDEFSEYLVGKLTEPVFSCISPQRYSKELRRWLEDTKIPMQKFLDRMGISITKAKLL